MRKIISNKIYDTEKAQLIGSWNNGATMEEFMEEILYIKKTNEFFLYGNGGQKTKYAIQTSQNWWSGGEKIMPLTYDEAQKWAESHLNGDEYEKFFGIINDDNNKRMVSVYLTVSIDELLKRNATKEGISKSEYVSKLLEKELKMEEK